MATPPRPHSALVAPESGQAGYTQSPLLEAFINAHKQRASCITRTTQTGTVWVYRYADGELLAESWVLSICGRSRGCGHDHPHRVYMLERKMKFALSAAHAAIKCDAVCGSILYGCCWCPACIGTVLL